MLWESGKTEVQNVSMSEEPVGGKSKFDCDLER